MMKRLGIHWKSNATSSESVGATSD